MGCWNLQEQIKKSNYKSSQCITDPINEDLGPFIHVLDDFGGKYFLESPKPNLHRLVPQYIKKTRTSGAKMHFFTKYKGDSISTVLYFKLGNNDPAFIKNLQDL